jgi:lysophospholipase L1-like esterase
MSAFVLVVWTVASGCSWWSSSEEAPSVLVVGDSVTRLSQEEIRDHLGWAATVDVRAEDGFRTDQLLASARRGIEADPDIAIVMPGYNDVLQDAPEAPALEEMAEIVAEVPCTVWVLLPTKAPYSTDVVERWNQRVAEAAAAHRSIHVSPEWKDLVDSAPGFTYVSEVDGVHPNDLGQRTIAEVMARAAERSCR